MPTELQKSKRRFSPAAWMCYWLPAMAAMLILCNCLAASTSGRPASRRLPIKTIWAGSQCGCEAQKPLVRWFTHQDQFADAVAVAKSTVLETLVSQHPMDWKRDGLVWICMGLKPSGGYALSLAGSSAVVSEAVAVITVHWRQPRPGSVVTQQLTSPCLLLSLPRDGFHTIQINDEAGRIRAALDVSHK